MSFLAPLLPVAGMAIGGLLGGAGSKTPQIPAPPPITPGSVNFQMPGFSGGGLTGTFANGMFGVTPDASRTAAIGGIQSTFQQQADALGALRAQWAPGASALRAAQLATLQSNRTAAIGNLRDNLAQRRILGSSFAQNSLAVADQEYQQKAAEIQANTFLQELSASQQLIQQQFTAARGAFQTGLDELNLEAGLSAELTGKAAGLLESAASVQAQLDTHASISRAQFATQTGIEQAKLNAKSAEGTGKFFGSLGQLGGSALAKMFGSSGGGGGGILTGGASLGLDPSTFASAMAAMA